MYFYHDQEEEISRLTAKLSVLRSQQEIAASTPQLTDAKSETSDDVRSSVTSLYNEIEADISCLAPR